MRIHEYQARQLLADAGIPVPPGRMVQSVDDAAAEAKALFDGGARIVVVKAQVHAGGRGKAGFVKVVNGAPEAREAAKFMLSNRMISPQTPAEGLDVRRLLVAAGVDIAKEHYLAIAMDRAARTATLIASAEGGVEIEAVAARNPEAIIRERLHPLLGLQPFQARKVAFALGFKGRQIGQATAIMLKLAQLFRDSDASLAEINPLVVTPPTEENPDGQVIAIDAKFSFDDNALFRQKKVAEMFDPTEENPAEIQANKFGLSYVALDGNIGCLVNGAGLAMSTMDIIKLHGGEPANFLDVGGGATEEAVTEAFRIILSDARVEGVLVNIFGGIMQCDRIARAIVAAAKEVGFTVPLVVRLEGTNVAEARRILDDARREIPTMQSATDLADAAERVCAAVAGFAGSGASSR
ncbi:MAG TPA: ADP-forming succinate--CoA ligase subunit beta [Phycisphaerales bacterium]|nr:ADP-forming succinate--CoA ligase subunit beta [Phycisphaerales bacterium]HMP36914.1 ADP-forming succinate--CoA ligase subunit beta [Phycisphaerales bacterium]